ncbi:MAG: dihydrofolate reductase family protein [Lachnospiraceae bacterium]|nr:dihydrofolate reductase family protein [Acetatifactor muris]MCM1224117.1 dihydrofolate reductase family protein [Lachnospiraceae bacterium]
MTNTARTDTVVSVVCHILCAVNGKISGDFFRAPELQPVSAAYGKIRAEYQSVAALCGLVTATEIYPCTEGGNRKEASQTFPRETWVAEHGEDHYNVVVDTEGSLQWENGTIRRPGQPEAHAVVILLESVPDAHLQHLRDAGVSYLFAGKRQLDAERAVCELKRAFGIDTLMVIGGGAVDWTFLQAGLIDELSLVVCPLADGQTDTASVFDCYSQLERKGPVAFSLADVQKLPGDGIWLRYNPKNAQGRGGKLQ